MQFVFWMCMEYKAEAWNASFKYASFWKTVGYLELKRNQTGISQLISITCVFNIGVLLAVTAFRQ